MLKLVLQKAEEPEIKLPTYAGSLKKQESPRKTFISALLTIPKSLTVWITIKLWKILKEMRIPDHLTCLLRNLYAGQEATVRTGHGKTDWLQIRKGVCQGCILSPCRAHHAKFWAGWVTSWNQDFQEIAGIIRYTDDTNQLAESKKDLKNLLMRMKEESEKAGLKNQH